MPSFSTFAVFADIGDEGGVLQEVNRILYLFDGFSPIVGTLIAVSATLVFLYFFWGLMDYIRKDEANLENAKKRMVWGAVGIFVLVSVWGLVYFLQTAILGTGDVKEPDIEFRKVESL